MIATTLNPASLIDLLTAACVFGLVLSIWLVALLGWQFFRTRRSKEINQRLGITRAAGPDERELHLWHEGEMATTMVPTPEPHRPIIDKFANESKQAGFDLSGPAMLAINVVVPIAAAIGIMVVSRNAALAVGIAIGAFVIIRITIKHRITKRETIFERQLVDALELAARSLRAGHPLMGAFQLVSEEMRPPVSTVFAEICQKQEMGANVEDVLRDAADRSPSPHVKLFATSVAIQMRSGGNLANLMQRLAGVIRNRIRLSRRVQILTAQTQMSKRVLIVMPFIMFLLLTAINPDYMMPFYTTTVGRLMLAAGVFLLALGSWVMNRLVAINI